MIRWRLHKGKNGKNVFQFQLRRRPGQGELVSQVGPAGLGQQPGAAGVDCGMIL